MYGIRGNSQPVPKHKFEHSRKSPQIIKYKNCHMKLGFLLFCLIIVACNSNDKSKEAAATEKDWALLPFSKTDSVNPVLLPGSVLTFKCPVRNDSVRWEEKDVFNPAAVVRNDTVFLLYRAEDSIGKFAGTSRLGLAWSTDGLHFTKHPVPVLYPDNDSLKKYEWEGGCEDPRIVEDENGVYYLTYTGYDGDKARLLVATSTDLYRWTKQGHAFLEINDSENHGEGLTPPGMKNVWSKSGSIVCTYKNGKSIATRINGKYWMYWGDTNIFLAFSNDLIHWWVVTDLDSNPQTVFAPRRGKFDSDLVEPGPPAMLTSKGIVLMYNSRNVLAKGDSSLPEHTYTASQILLDASDPSKVLDRMDTWFIKPDKPYEITGQVNQVCFIEGLVNFKDQWYLYYGTADSKIAVAVK